MPNTYIDMARGDKILLVTLNTIFNMARREKTPLSHHILFSVWLGEDLPSWSCCIPFLTQQDGVTPPCCVEKLVITLVKLMFIKLN